MEPNPYLFPQPEGNPYLSAAIQREADAQTLRALTRLIPHSPTSNPYSSAFDLTEEIHLPSHDAKAKVSRITPTELKSSPSAYQSPQEILHETAKQQQQEQTRLKQAILPKQYQEKEQLRQETEQRQQLESQAKAFLEEIHKLDPLEGDRLWFESFAQHCTSREQAALEFIRAMSKISA